MTCWGNSEQQLAYPKTLQVGLHPAVNETLNIDFGDLPTIEESGIFACVQRLTSRVRG